MVESRLRYTFVPRVVGEVPAGTPRREQRLKELSEFMQVPDSKVLTKEKEKLTGSVAEQNKLRSMLAKKHKQLDGEMTEDRDKSVALLRYATHMLNLLKEKVAERDSNNLTKLYNGCIRGVTYMISDGYLDRPFNENEKRFLDIEPILTTCCTACNVSSAGDNVQGILVASFASPESQRHLTSRGKAREADVISLAANRGKPFKDEEDIRKAMAEDGTLGIYRKLREQPGFDGYEADFQDRVNAFISVANMAWEIDVPGAANAEANELAEFMKIKSALLDEMVDFLPLLNATKEKWKLGSEIHQRHTRNCAFLSLLDIVERASQVATEKNIIGLYGLVAGLRTTVSNTLSDGFFKKNDTEVLYDYLRNIEPQLVAFSKLSGMELKERSLEISSQHDKAFEFYGQSVAFVNERIRSQLNQ